MTDQPYKRQQDHLPPPKNTGAIPFFVRHATAANLLMVLILIVGFVGLTRLNAQLMPDADFEFVRVQVIWPGATASDVDQTIVQAIEPEVRFLNGVDQVRSSSREGSAHVNVQFLAGTDMSQALSEVEAAVDQIQTFPEEAERPIITRIVPYETVTRVLLSGPFSEQALVELGRDMRDDLLALGVDKVDMVGVRPREIWIEVPPATLRRLDLTLGDISQAVQATSIDVPSGNIERSGRQVRSLGLLTEADELNDIEVKTLPGGKKIFLGDIATVSDTYAEGGVTARSGGERAVELHIQRSKQADSLEVAGIVQDYLERTLPTLPPNLNAIEYDNWSNLISDRIGLLVRNALGGMVLVLIVLFLFLNFRVAFWVAVGIPIAIFGGFALMWATGQTLNMLAMMGILLALGLVVDDAIVVGEHSEFRFKQGLGPADAATAGVQRMTAPVLCATLTTAAAFLPLLMIGGFIGEMISAVPYVVVAMLLASVLECFFILPAHMHHALIGNAKAKQENAFTRFRERFDARFRNFRDTKFRGLVEIGITHRYVTVAAAVALFIVAMGLANSGRVGFVFFPEAESDTIYANVVMQSSASRDLTIAQLDEVERALYVAAKKLDGEDTDLVTATVIKVGTTVGREGPGGGADDSSAPPDAKGGVSVVLKNTDDRDFRNPAILAAWRAEVETLAGLETLTIEELRGGPGGADIAIRIEGDDVAALKAASRDVQAMLARYPGVSNIEDNLPSGKPEVILELTPMGRNLGFTTQTVGNQVRAAIEGVIVKRFADGNDEVTIRAQYPRDMVDSAVLETMYLRTPQGGEVPLLDVVETREIEGFDSIRRVDGTRTITVEAELDETVIELGTLMRSLPGEGLNDIMAKHGVSRSFQGGFRDQQEAFADVMTGAMVGLACIYIILAWVFSSYTRPLAVMIVIPFGYVGMVFMHILFGFQLTIMSYVGLVGLSGIIINDSIVLITTIAHRMKTQGLHDAIVDGSLDRFRPVVLTSLTTIGGLTPLVFETSFQAQFLIPIALTIVGGVALGTLLILVVVPSIMAIQHDLGQLRAGKAQPQPAE